MIAARLRQLAGRLSGGGTAQGRIVPPSGFTVWLTFASAAAMAFLAVFALAVALASGQVARAWEDALARTATVRISAPADQLERQAEAVLTVLAQTPGVAAARRISADEQAALLAPWLGQDLPLDLLPMPALIELTEDDPGYDAEGLRLRLVAEAPGAVLDDHGRWRRPLVQAAGHLRLMGGAALLLIAAATAAMVVLAAQSALAANRQVIRTLRLIGATDQFIASAFVRRFSWRAGLGALAGTLAGMAGLALMPELSLAGTEGQSAGFSGTGWLLPLVVPVLAALVAYGATRYAAFRTLRETT